MVFLWEYQDDKPLVSLRLLPCSHAAFVAAAACFATEGLESVERRVSFWDSVARWLTSRLRGRQLVASQFHICCSRKAYMLRGETLEVRNPCTLRTCCVHTFTWGPGTRQERRSYLDQERVRGPARFGRMNGPEVRRRRLITPRRRTAKFEIGDGDWTMGMDEVAPIRLGARGANGPGRRILLGGGRGWWIPGLGT